LQRAEIAGVYNIRLQPLEGFEEIDINTEIVPLALMQRHDFHILGSDAAAKIGVSLQTNNGMSITLGRNMIDQVHQAVFQAPDTQVINYMDDKRRALGTTP